MTPVTIPLEGEPPVTMQQLQRIVVIGTSGSGKTTYAAKLAAILGSTHIEIDALHWLPDWKPREREDFRSLVSAAISEERWSSDGNYGAVRDIIWARATAVIWLNYSFPVTGYRIMRRTLGRIIRKQLLYSDNRESFAKAFFSRDSILLWVLQTYWKHRRAYPDLFRDPRFAAIRFLVFTTPAGSERFLESLRDAREEGSIG